MTTDGGETHADADDTNAGAAAASTDSSDETEPYADLGATTEDAMAIAETSMDRVRELVPDETLADRVRQKAVHATGDPEFQFLVRFTANGRTVGHARGHDAGRNEDDSTRGDAAPTTRDVANAPVRAGARAVLDERSIVTDITMVQAGITGRGHDCQVRKAIGNGSDLAAETGMTRTAASVLELDRRGVYDDAIAVVGNAPTAALALADCIEQGTRPAVVVATPVGFVKAAESRQRLREVAADHDVPAITTVGRRGGSGLAAGLTNELVHVASDARDGDVALDDDVAAGGRQSDSEADDAPREHGGGA